ncbi:MAG: tRNA (adenosine(37)-N6)-dimethylallyltransferase MiaA [Armatimonadetes bacterium]|nr:tRNA (adenosine(37)-N6)-dimethylallyltransferase MiaA [Armatimonadota bacterium]
MPPVIPLLVIAGPTASGKTEAAIRVARCVGGEIVSADSMQIYRGLDVGTAKPTSEERRAARFHLVDCVDLDQPYTVADFQRDARRAIREIYGRGNLPILCGGTGLYIRALLRHFDFPPAQAGGSRVVRRRLEDELAQLGSEAMHARLASADPVAAAEISPSDSKRIVRALEVLEITGNAISEQRRVDATPEVHYNALYLVISRPREALYEGIDARVDRMLSHGWLDEVRAIDARGLQPALPSLQALGYRQMLAWLNFPGPRESFAQVVASIKRETRRFAKRQLTWFRREEGAVWREWRTDAEFALVEAELCRLGAQLAWGAQSRRFSGA